MAGKNEQFTFPKGEALFARLDQPYTFSKRDKRTVACKPSDNGAAYSIAIKLPMKEASPIIKKIKDVWAKYDSKENDSAANWPFVNEKDRETGEPTGNIIFKTKFNASWTNKDGSFASVPIYDAKGHKLPKTFDIGNGSIIRVGVEFVPHDMQGGGVSLRLKGVQVIKPNGGGFDAMFNEEDGYESDGEDEEVVEETTKSSTDEDEEIPF